MRKRILGLCLGAGLLCMSALTAGAQTYYGESDWKVAFTQEQKMESNFKSSDLAEAVSGLQPGDTIHLTLSLANQNSSATDWYMTNKVLYSLEDRSANSATGGGAYTYRLVYTDPSGEENVLFDSDTVGGEEDGKSGEGLHQATNALEDYFYLDTLSGGQSGKVDLSVSLDGETQGNAYQDTLADLEMNFGVELNEDGTPPGGNAPGAGDNDEGNGQPSGSNEPETRSGSSLAASVDTGDDNISPLYVSLMAVSGCVLLGAGVVSLRRSRRNGKGASDRDA